MRRFGLALLLLAGAVAPARAQQGDTVTVTLERALEIARVNNPEYRRAANSVELNGPETRAAWTRDILPRLSLGLATNYSGNLQRRALDPFGNPVANPDAEYVYFSGTRQSIGLQWQLRGPSLLNAKKRLNAVNDERLLTESLGTEKLRIEVERRFFAALEQEELLEAERAVAEASRTDQETAQRLFEIALRTRVDVLQAELQSSQQQLAVGQAQGRVEQARLALRTTLGQIELPPVRPAATEPPVFDPSALDAEALVRRAASESALVRRQGWALDMADVGVSQAHGVYWPSLTAGLDVGRNVQGQQSGSLFSFGGFGNALYSSFQVMLSLPFLNDPFTNRLSVARAEVDRDNQREALREAQLAAEQATRSALVTLRDRWAALTIADRSRAIAGEALELAREEYQLGGRTFDQVQQSVRDEAQARRQLIDARYGFVNALLDLETAVGGTVR